MMRRRINGCIKYLFFSLYHKKKKIKTRGKKFQSQGICIYMYTLNVWHHALTRSNENTIFDFTCSSFGWNFPWIGLNCFPSHRDQKKKNENEQHHWKNRAQKKVFRTALKIPKHDFQTRHFQCSTYHWPIAQSFLNGKTHIVFEMNIIVLLWIVDGWICVCVYLLRPLAHLCHFIYSRWHKNSRASSSLHRTLIWKIRHCFRINWMPLKTHILSGSTCQRSNIWHQWPRTTEI